MLLRLVGDTVETSPRCVPRGVLSFQQLGPLSLGTGTTPRPKVKGGIQNHVSGTTSAAGHVTNNPCKQSQNQRFNFRRSLHVGLRHLIR